MHIIFERQHIKLDSMRQEQYIYSPTSVRSRHTAIVPLCIVFLSIRSISKVVCATGGHSCRCNWSSLNTPQRAPNKTTEHRFEHEGATLETWCWVPQSSTRLAESAARLANRRATWSSTWTNPARTQGNLDQNEPFNVTVKTKWRLLVGICQSCHRGGPTGDLGSPR